LFQIVEKIGKDEIGTLPYLYIVCGTDDGFLEGNRDFAAMLREKLIPVEYRESPGGHDWDYWDRELKNVLKIVNARLSAG